MSEREDAKTRPLSELRDSGLLWLINRVALHPRGFGLALVQEAGEVTGWQLVGDGSEVWSFPVDDEHEKFAAVEMLFADRRPA